MLQIVQKPINNHFTQTTSDLNKWRSNRRNHLLLSCGCCRLKWNEMRVWWLYVKISCNREEKNQRRDFLLTIIVYQLLSRWIPQFQRPKMAYPDHICLRPQWFYTILLELRLTRTAHSCCTILSWYNDQKQFLNLDFIPLFFLNFFFVYV